MYVSSRFINWQKSWWLHYLFQEHVGSSLISLHLKNMFSVTSWEQLFTQVTAFLQNSFGKKHYFFFQPVVFFKMVRHKIFALLQGNTRKSQLCIKNVEFLSHKRLSRHIFFHSQYFTELFQYSYKINIAKEEEIQTPYDVYI